MGRTSKETWELEELEESLLAAPLAEKRAACEAAVFIEFLGRVDSR